MRIYRDAVVKDWDNRVEYLLADMPKKEALEWMEQHEGDLKDMIAFTNEQERAFNQPQVIKPLDVGFVQVMPSRDFVVVYHGPTDGPVAKKFVNKPGKLESVVSWYASRGVTAFVH